MSKLNKRGLLILFEGPDRCGKSTQVKLLYNYIVNNGSKAKIISFPKRDTVIGKTIDKCLRGELKLNKTALQLLFCANFHEVKDEIESDIKDGINIILDRYVYSNIIYSIANNINGGTIQNAIDLPMPDITYVLSISVEELLKRKDFGKELFETFELQKKVIELFNGLQKNPIFDGENICYIDCNNKNIEMIRKLVFNYLNSYIAKKEITMFKLK
jgi:dTMP kinase